MQTCLIYVLLLFVLGHPPLFFVYCKMHFLILGQSVGIAAVEEGKIDIIVKIK